MTVNRENLPDLSVNTNSENDRSSATSPDEKILCPHCRRTSSNGIKCKGICVADSDY
jgi:hypothetical protein